MLRLTKITVSMLQSVGCRNIPQKHITVRGLRRCGLTTCSRESNLIGQLDL